MMIKCKDCGLKYNVDINACINIGFKATASGFMGFREQARTGDDHDVRTQKLLPIGRSSSLILEGESMGQVRTTHIKKLCNELLERYPDKFGNDFDKNKKVLDELMKTESKKIRNTLAGFITHSVQKLEKLHTLKVSYQPPLPDKRRRRRRRKKKR